MEFVSRVSLLHRLIVDTIMRIYARIETDEGTCGNVKGEGGSGAERTRYGSRDQVSLKCDSNMLFVMEPPFKDVFTLMYDLRAAWISRRMFHGRF